MLTLRELRNLITIAECPKRVPTPKQLKESGIEVIAKEMIDKETWICVYANGLVQYRVGKRYTVFSIIACGAYEYESVNNESKVYRASFFEDERWYIRLIMEGEDRMAETQEKRKLRNKVFSYEQIINDFGDIADPSEDILEVLIKKDLAMELLEQLTERQRTVVYLRYFYQLNQKEIADYFGISQQRVSEILSRAKAVLTAYTKKYEKFFV